MIELVWLVVGHADLTGRWLGDGNLKIAGMTLDKVIVNIAKCSEQGQTYVALSRARSLKALGRNIKCDEQVIGFWKKCFESVRASGIRRHKVGMISRG